MCPWMTEQCDNVTGCKLLSAFQTWELYSIRYSCITRSAMTARMRFIAKMLSLLTLHEWHYVISAMWLVRYCEVASNVNQPQSVVPNHLARGTM